MDLRSSFTIGRIRGIAIQVHWSWLLILGLVTWSLAEGLFGQEMGASPSMRWLAGLATSLLFFSSVMLHELAHSFVAQAYGMQVPSITLFVFGGVSSLAGEMRSAGEEFRVAIVGPLTSWVLAVVFGILSLVTEGTLNTMFGYLAFINVALGVFNLLPGFPLDGGRVFRSIVWARTGSLERATSLAARVGIGIAYLMIAGGLFSTFAFGVGGLWYILIGLFLKSASEGAYATLMVETALRDVPVASAMQAPPATVQSSATLQQLIDERVLTSGERAYLVEDMGRVVGLVSTSDVAKIPRDEWGQRTVQSAMVPAEHVQTVAPSTRLLEAMRLLQEHDIHQLPVLDGGAVVGILTRADVMRHIELRAAFGANGSNDGRPGGSTRAAG